MRRISAVVHQENYEKSTLQMQKQAVTLSKIMGVSGPNMNRLVDLLLEAFWKGNVDLASSSKLLNIHTKE